MNIIELFDTYDGVILVIISFFIGIGAAILSEDFDRSYARFFMIIMAIVSFSGGLALLVC